MKSDADKIVILEAEISELRLRVARIEDTHAAKREMASRSIEGRIMARLWSGERLSARVLANRLKMDADTIEGALERMSEDKLVRGVPGRVYNGQPVTKWEKGEMFS